jgi:distribution and morphology protein 31
LSIFSADLPLFRQEWILYDVMAADSMIGMFDNCLFSIHKVGDAGQDALSSRLLPTPTSGHRPLKSEIGISRILAPPVDWKSSKVSRLRVHGVPIDFFNYGAGGPFGWITAGTLDMDVKVQMPERMVPPIRDVRLEDLDSKRTDMIEGAAMLRASEIFFSNVLALREREAGPHEKTIPGLLTNPPTVVHMFVDVRLNNLKASVPLQTEHISFLSNAMIRPVVAYVNANRTSIPLSFAGQIPMVKSLRKSSFNETTINTS